MPQQDPWAGVTQLLGCAAAGVMQMLGDVGGFAAVGAAAAA